MAYSPTPSFLTVERFEAWLRQQPSTNVVGTPADGNACPLATFINDQGEYAWVNVDNLSVRVDIMLNDIDSTSVFYETPLKLSQFITAVDDCEQLDITAAQALMLLREVIERLL